MRLDRTRYACRIREELNPRARISATQVATAGCSTRANGVVPNVGSTQVRSRLS